MARIVYRDENYQTIYVDVNAQQSEVTIGRNPGNLVVIPAKSLSRFHAKIVFQNGRYFLLDLKSSNGSFVNNARVSQQEIRPGDKLRFGDVNVDFVAEQRMMAPPPQAPRPAQPPRPVAAPRLNAPVLQMPPHSAGDMRNVALRPISSQGTYRPTMPNQPVFDEEMAKVAAGQVAGQVEGGAAKPGGMPMPSLPSSGISVLRFP